MLLLFIQSQHKNLLTDLLTAKKTLSETVSGGCYATAWQIESSHSTYLELFAESLVVLVCLLVFVTFEASVSSIRASLELEFITSGKLSK